MKVEETNEGINLFLNNTYFQDVNWNEKISIEAAAKEIFLKVKSNFRIKLKGFYKIKIYPNEVGVFMEVKKIDDDNYDGSEINFRIIVVFNKDMYLKLDDIFYVNQDCEKLYYNNNYYIRLDDISNIFSLIDYGDVVLDDEIDFEKSIFLK